jgi:hypothetical protein
VDTDRFGDAFRHLDGKEFVGARIRQLGEQ